MDAFKEQLMVHQLDKHTCPCCYINFKGKNKSKLNRLARSSLKNLVKKEIKQEIGNL